MRYHTFTISLWILRCIRLTFDDVYGQRKPLKWSESCSRQSVKDDQKASERIRSSCDIPAYSDSTWRNPPQRQMIPGVRDILCMIRFIIHFEAHLTMPTFRLHRWYFGQIAKDLFLERGIEGGREKPASSELSPSALYRSIMTTFWAKCFCSSSIPLEVIRCLVLASVFQVACLCAFSLSCQRALRLFGLNSRCFSRFCVHTGGPRDHLRGWYAERLIMHLRKRCRVEFLKCV